MKLLDEILNFGFCAFIFFFSLVVIMSFVSLPGVGLYFAFINLYNNDYFICAFAILPFLIFYALFFIRLLLNAFLNEEPYNNGVFGMLRDIRKDVEKSYNNLKNEIGN